MSNAIAASVAARLRRAAPALVMGVFLLGVPRAAHAEWYLSPFLGANVGGNATEKSASVGVSGGWLGARMLGAEGDVSWSPGFFRQSGFLSDRRLVTAMANVIVAAPAGTNGHLRPYVSGGLGVLKPKESEVGGLFALDVNKFGYNVGAGAMAFFNQNVGIRGDVRYFHAAGSSDSDTNDFSLDLSSFHFWRVSAGLAVRF